MAPRDLQQGIRGSGCWQGPLAFGPSWVAHGTFLEPGAIVGPSWGDVRSPIPNTASRRLQDSPGGVSGTFLPPPGKMCTNLFNVFLASSLCHFSSCPLPFFSAPVCHALSTPVYHGHGKHVDVPFPLPFQLLSTVSIGALSSSILPLHTVTANGGTALIKTGDDCACAPRRRLATGAPSRRHQGQDLGAAQGRAA